MTNDLIPYDDFLKRIGHCITYWAFIEEMLFEICVATLKAPRKQTAIVYYRTPTLEARLSLVQELVAAKFPRKKPGQHSSTLEITWSNLVKEATDLIPERNTLAHRPLKGILISGLSSDGEAQIKYSVRLHKNERLRGRSVKADLMDADSLSKHLKRVRILEEGLRRFNYDLRTMLLRLSRPPKGGQ